VSPETAARSATRSRRKPSPRPDPDPLGRLLVASVRRADELGEPLVREWLAKLLRGEPGASDPARK
jgi:hypothetical protein